MGLRVYVSKACFSLQVLLGAQAGMMQLQGKLEGSLKPKGLWHPLGAEATADCILGH